MLEDAKKSESQVMFSSTHGRAILAPQSGHDKKTSNTDDNMAAKRELTTSKPSMYNTVAYTHTIPMDPHTEPQVR